MLHERGVRGKNMILRLALLGLGLAGLTACLSVPDTAERAAPQSVAVTQAAVVVAGPPGFCVDTDASRNAKSKAFVLLGSCAAISSVALAPQPDLPVILTASVAAMPSPNLSDAVLDAYFRSDAGRAQLSPRGKSDDVEILTTRSEHGAFFLYAQEAGDRTGQWRGIVQLDAAMVTLSLRPTAREAMSDAARFALIDAFASSLQAANPVSRLSAQNRAKN